MVHLVGVRSEVGVMDIRWVGELKRHGRHLIWQEMWKNIRVGKLRVGGCRRLEVLG